MVKMLGLITSFCRLLDLSVTVSVYAEIWYLKPKQVTQTTSILAAVTLGPLNWDIFRKIVRWVLCEVVGNMHGDLY